MPTLRSNGISLAYEITGSGPPLLLISGLGYGSWIWRRVAPLLAADHSVITFDNRGAGGSDKPEGPYSTPQMALDTAGLLDGLGVAGARVLGHSLGGLIAQELALARPDLVGRLILASTTHGGKDAVPIPPDALAVMLDRRGPPEELIGRGIAVATAPGWMAAHAAEVEELVRYRLTSPVPPAAYAAQVAAGAAHDASQRVGRIDVPTLIISGDKDRVVPIENATLLASKMKRSTPKLISNAGHLLPIEAPEALAAAVRAFLTELAS